MSADGKAARSPRHAQPVLFEAESPAPMAKPRPRPVQVQATAKPRGRPRKVRGSLPEADVARVFEALHAACLAIAEREGVDVNLPARTPKALDSLAKLIGDGWSVEQLLQSLENRGRIGSTEELRYLTKVAFSPGAVEWGLNIQPHEMAKVSATATGPDGFIIDRTR